MDPGALGVRALSGLGQKLGRARLVVGALLVSGCFSPPRRASMNAGVPTAATASAQGPEEGGEAAMASDGWRRSGSVAPVAVLGRGRRVVVTEFAVELVDYQFQLPAPRQVMFKTPPITPNPIHVALRLVGIAR